MITMNNEQKKNLDIELNTNTKEILDVIAWRMYCLPRPIEADCLYHYYKGKDILKVLRNDNIVFRLASLSTFEDKMEGKSVEVYFDLALQELLGMHKINQKEYDELSAILIPEQAWLMCDSVNGYRRFSLCEYDEYVICFSKEKDDSYMYENYCKESDGYCLEFPTIELNEVTCKALDNSAEMTLMPILYGREVVDYIEAIILEVLHDKAKRHYLKECIQDLLHIVQYSAKLSKYRKEKEVRLVVLLPKQHTHVLPDIEHVNSDDGNKYIYLKIPKKTLTAISAAPFNSKGETMHIIDSVKKAEYVFAE